MKLYGIITNKISLRYYTIKIRDENVFITLVGVTATSPSTLFFLPYSSIAENASEIRRANAGYGEQHKADSRNQ